MLFYEGIIHTSSLKNPAGFNIARGIKYRVPFVKNNQQEHYS